MKLFINIQKAMINKDIKFLKTIYTKTATLKHISGKKQNINEFLNELENGTLNYYKSELKEYTINITNNNATIKGTLILTAKVYGSNGIWTLKMNRTFQKINKKWYSDKEIYTL